MFLELTQDLRIQKLKMLSEIQVSIRQELRVRSVVVLLVEFFDLLVAESGDVFGVASRVEFILTVFEERFIESVDKFLLRPTHGSFHLVVDHTLVLELRFRIGGFFEFETPAFLKEVFSLELGEEGEVSVHLQQIVEIILVLSGKRVHGEVHSCPGVHVSVQRSFHHRKEGVSHWVVLTPTSSQVLKDVRLSCVVIWRRSEKHSERILEVCSV